MIIMTRILSLLVAAAAGLSAQDLPRVDLHVHIHDDEHPAQSMKPADAVALSQKMGVRFGILAEGGCRGDIHNDQTLEEFLNSVEGLPVYRGLQVYGFDWSNCLSKQNIGRLDYISADALVFPNGDGRNILLWLPGVKFDDPQDFMDRYVDFTVKILSQPIQIWANPTYLPESLKAQYGTLWTQRRMQRVIEAAVHNHVAIEINSHFQIPSAAFIRKAKAAGAKFSFGSNEHVHGIGNIAYPLAVARECGLTRSDIYVPARRSALGTKK
jgi:hypothetical protein